MKTIMKPAPFVLFTLLLSAAKVAECAKILMIFPMPAKSHYILGSALARGLAGKGHEITMVSAFGEKNPPMNYRDILVSDAVKLEVDNKKFDLFDFANIDPFSYLLAMNAIGNSMTEAVLNHTNVQALLKSNQKFDVVILEQFANEAHKAFAHHFKIPMILFVTFGSNSMINPLVGNPAPPSYVAELVINFSHKSFIDRVKNTVVHLMFLVNNYLVFYPAQNKIMKKYFPNAPDLDVLNHNASLVLLNSHWSTNKAVPRVPNMIDIGGFHVKPAEGLPKHLQEFLDNSKEGVIYFSMGSALQSVNLPVKKRDILLKVFSKLKQNVLWKWENDTIPEQPANVKLGKWLPQQDILAHRNIKLFITHGGLLSTIESVYHGVPVVVIPVFGDQKVNAVEAVSNGFGIEVPFEELSEEKLTAAINELLNNNKYRNNMKRRSKIMHDRQNSPIDDADYWVNYVIRHQGAVHLRNDGLDLSWYQYMGLDVAVFLIAVLCLTFKTLKFLLIRQKGSSLKVKTS